MKKGQNYEIHVPYKANPKPSAEWTINDKELTAESDRLVVKVIFLKNISSILKIFSIFLE